MNDRCLSFSLQAWQHHQLAWLSSSFQLAPKPPQPMYNVNKHMPASIDGCKIRELQIITPLVEKNMGRENQETIRRYRDRSALQDAWSKLYPHCQLMCVLREYSSENVLIIQYLGETLLPRGMVYKTGELGRNISGLGALNWVILCRTLWVTQR